jgi:hypothetical protein
MRYLQSCNLTFTNFCGDTNIALKGHRASCTRHSACQLSDIGASKRRSSRDMAPIPCTEQYFAYLACLVEPAEVLEKHSFITRQLTEEELLGKRRCSGCGKSESHPQGKTCMRLTCYSHGQVASPTKAASECVFTARSRRSHYNSTTD